MVRDVKLAHSFPPGADVRTVVLRLNDLASGEHEVEIVGSITGETDTPNSLVVHAVSDCPAGGSGGCTLASDRTFGLVSAPCLLLSALLLSMRSRLRHWHSGEAHKTS